MKTEKFKMEIDKTTLMWIAIIVLFLAVLFLTYKVSVTGSATSTGKLDTRGWTENEIMNYEMHGTIPARVKGSSASSSGMVGGC